MSEVTRVFSEEEIERAIDVKVINRLTHLQSIHAGLGLLRNVCCVTVVQRLATVHVCAFNSGENDIGFAH